MAQRTEHIPKPETISRGRINWMDVVVILGIAAFSAAWHWYRWRGITPFIFLNSDAANIASFTAAWSHPELFRHDALLSNTDNFRFYATIHIPLLRMLMHFFDDYGSAFMAMLGPHVFVQTLGFYILGRVLFKDRFWAVLLAVINLRHIPTGIGADFWGIYVDAIPRFTFQALLPYLMAAAYVWRREPKKWPWLMILAGLLMYVHPPSAPAIGFALWLGLWIDTPPEWTMRNRLGAMFGLGILFLAVTAPFVINYISNHAHGTISQDYDAVFQAMNYRFNNVFTNIPFAIRHSVIRMAETMLLPAALAGAGTLLYLFPEKKKTINRFGLWAAGIIFVSYIIPLAEHMAGKFLEMIPLEIDLIRGVRYLYPIGLIFCLWPLSALAQSLTNARSRAAVYALGLIGVLGWSMILRPPWMVDKPADMFLKPRTGPIHAKQHEMIDMLKTIKDRIPADASILATSESNPLAIRYYAMRSVALSVKDGGCLSFTDPKALLQWYENWRKMETYETMPKGPEKLAGLLDVARTVGADYLLVDFNSSEFPSPDAKPVYSNPGYTLLKLTNPE